MKQKIGKPNLIHIIYDEKGRKFIKHLCHKVKMYSVTLVITYILWSLYFTYCFLRLRCETDICKIQQHKWMLLYIKEYAAYNILHSKWQKIKGRTKTLDLLIEVPQNQYRVILRSALMGMVPASMTKHPCTVYRCSSSQPTWKPIYDAVQCFEMFYKCLFNSSEHMQSYKTLRWQHNKWWHSTIWNSTYTVGLTKLQQNCWYKV